MIYVPEAPWCIRCGEVLENETLEWHHGWVCHRCLRPEDNPEMTQEELDELTDRRLAEYDRKFVRKTQEVFLHEPEAQKCTRAQQ